MDELHRAKAKLVALEQEKAGVEDAVLEALQATHPSLATVAKLETSVAALRKEIEEQRSLIEFYEARHEAVLKSTSTELFMLVYQSQRVDRDDDALSQKSLRWSKVNQEMRITSLLVATNDSFFGIIEGDKSAITDLFGKIQKDPSHRNCRIIVVQRLTCRQWSIGLVLRYVADPLLREFLDAFRAIGGDSTRFSPRSMKALSESGGNISGTVSTSKQAVVLAVTLDTVGGDLPTARDYEQLASHVTEETERLNGDVVERFGEWMVCVFQGDLSKELVTSVCGIADSVYKRIPNSISATHIGTIATPLTNKISAFGPGIADTISLLHLAESCRRPMLCTPIVFDRVSKAVYPFNTFTVDNVRYYTLRVIGERRLAVPQKPMVEHHADSMAADPPASDYTNTLPQEELIAEVEREPLVKGALTRNEMLSIFRELDPGNVGWISKERFRKMIAESTRFPVFNHDMKRVDSWLQKFNRIGRERLSFEEFAILCLRLEQQ
jgi:hypothetical protein